MKKFSLFILGILFCATNAWGQMSGTYNNVSYSVTMGMPGYASVIGVVGNPSELTIPATIPSLTITSAPQGMESMVGMSLAMSFSVNQIAAGAFDGKTMTTLTLETTDAMTFNTALPSSVTKLRLPASAQSMYQSAAVARMEASNNTDMSWSMAIMANMPQVEWYSTGVATSGNCGDADYNLGGESDLTWSYDADSRTLTFTNNSFSGGDVYMADYTLDDNYPVNSSCPWYAFKSEITSVVFPSNLKNIGNNAFYNFSGLTSVEIPNVTKIGDLAFCNCLNLTDVTIKSTGDDLTIGASAFAASTERSLFLTMKTATAPTIDESSFTNRKGLNSNPKVAVTVPSAQAKTNYESAWGTTKFEFTVAAISSGTCGTDLNWSYDNHVLTISGTGTTMTDFETTFENYVISWTTPWDEFLNDITSINITAPNLQHIGDNAFRGCHITATPTFPSSLQTIGEYAFGDCRQLTTATIPAAITSLGQGAFYNTVLNSVTFEANSHLTAISDDLFEYCKFEEITLPNGITSIGENAFASNDELTSITIPATVASIGYGAFAYCDNLSTFIFEGNTPPTIPFGSVLPNEATIIAPAAVICDYANALGFYSTAGNPYTYKTSINGDAVVCTPSGTCGEHLTWSVDPETFVLTIEGYGSMTEYASYEDVPWIKSGIYRVITEVVLPEGLTTIGKSAFLNHSNLRIVSIPSTLTTIGVSAFSGCSKLKEMKVLATTTPPTLATQVFGGCTLYPIEGYLDISVPESALETYKLLWGESLPESSGTFLESPITYPGCTMVYYPIASDKEDDVVAVCSDASADMTNEKLEVMADANNGAGTEIGQFTIARPIQANGNLNTICLPFALSAAQIAKSDLAGATIYAFTAEDGVSEEKLLTLSPVTSMQAGVPYFFAYTNNAANTPNLSKLVFNDVLLTTAVEEPVDLDAGTFVLHGTLRPTRLNHASNYLFLGAENSLFYPQLEGTTEAEQTINPFRAYFEAKNSANQAPARFVFGRPVPTDVDNVQSDKVQCTKVHKNGQIIILRGENYYSLDGKKL